MPYKNKDEKKAYDALYYQKNKELLNKKNSIYQKTKGKKSHTLASWKYLGIKDEDLSSVYDYFITQTHCWICGVKYRNLKERHLDHDHESGEIRYIICYKCNMNILRKY